MEQIPSHIVPVREIDEKIKLRNTRSRSPKLLSKPFGSGKGY